MVQLVNLELAQLKKQSERARRLLFLQQTIHIAFCSGKKMARSIKSILIKVLAVEDI